MTLEKLIEQRSAVIEKLEAVKNVAMTETRAFTNEEITKVEEYKEEVRRLDATIKSLEETMEFKESEKEEDQEVRSLAKEIMGLDVNKEIEVGNYEVRAKAHSIYKATDANHENLSNIAKKTYADYILDKLTYTSPLYAAIRKERFSSSNHQIPVQATKLGKFVAMEELADYAKQAANFTPINLQAVKFGTMISFSEELIEDHGYNIEAELLRQLSEAYSVSVEELVVKGGTGATAGTVDGLEKFNATATAAGADGSKGVKLPVNGAITIDHVLEMYHALPIRYRSMATWVISDDMAKKLATLKDGNGMPLLTASYNNSPFGASHTLLGRPVIVSEHVKADYAAGNKVMFFGDLSRCLIIGERRSLKLTKSTEYGFIRDEIAIKASMRLDIKKGLGEAIVLGVTGA